MLRSVLSQLEFTYLVRDYDRKGVPFRSHIHCPEVHPETGSVFCEREDAGHVLKVRLVSMLNAVLFTYLSYRE